MGDQHSYPFQKPSWRAQALKVVDGDTADLFVDTGFRGYHLFRVRFLDIDTPEMNSKDPDERARAREAKELVQELFDCFEKTTKVDLAVWPLRVETAMDPDNFGRWLGRIFFVADGVERGVNAVLLERGLAALYEK